MADEVMVDVTIDQAMLDANPTLVEEGHEVGDVIQRPETAEEKTARLAAAEEESKEDEEESEDDSTEDTSAAGGTSEDDANGKRHPTA